MIRRWRNLVGRRGRFWLAPPAPAATPPPVPPAFKSARRAVNAVKRGRFQVAPVAVAQPPRFLAPRRRGFVALRGGAFLPVLAVPSVPVGFVGSDRRAAVLARRGRVFAVPPAVVQTAGPSPVVPTLERQARRPQLPTRRGEFLPPPIAVQIPAGAAPVPPQLKRTVRRPQVTVRRGEFVTLVPVPQAPAAPGFVPRPARRSAVRSLLIRRGEFLLVPPSSTPVPPALRRAPRRMVIARRGEFQPVPSRTVTPLLPPPDRLRRRRVLVWPPRGSFFQPVTLAMPVGVVIVAGDPRLSLLPNLAGITVASNLGGLTVAPNLADAAVAANQAEAVL